MGSRGQAGKTEKQRQGGSGGSRGRSAVGGGGEGYRQSDDFTRRGVGDKIGVVGQHKRGRKSTGNEYYKKRKKRK